MSRTHRDLEAKLGKKWLSSNAVREGLLTSLILTLQEAGETGDVEGRVDRAAQEEFRREQADEEYAPPETIRTVLAAIETRLDLDRLPAELVRRHRDVCAALLGKVDQQSGYR
jgi:hypothetical protein